MGLSDIILAVTLFVNAGAILNFKLGKPNENFDFVAKEPTVGDKVRESLKTLRYFRIFIALWNLVMMVMMILVFS